MKKHRFFDGRWRIFMQVSSLQLILIALLSAIAQATPTRGQEILNRKITVMATDEPINIVLTQVEEQAGVTFFYSSNLIGADRKVTVRAKQERLENVLNQLLKPLQIGYEVSGRQIILNRRSTSGLVPNLLPVSPVSEPKSVDRTISGIVTDTENGQPLPGVSVVIKNTTRGTSTDATGSYRLTVPDNSPDLTLVFSFVGYKTQETLVGNQTVVNLALAAGDRTLSEVVVVGYGEQKKVNLTGAVAQISNQQIQDRPFPSVTQALQGQLPGLQIVNGGGAPGREVTTIRLRGISTMNQGAASPLVIIDGVESSLNDLNPEDIATVSVLKDAASAAIYGSRAANGVILVTTKRGKTGAPRVSYSGYVGQQSLVTQPTYVNSADYARYINEALVGEGSSPRYTDAEIQKFRDGSDPDHYPNSSYSKEFYKNSGLQHNHTVQVSGGSDATQYLFSLGYLNQKGLAYANGYERLTPRLNLDSKVNRWLTIGTTGTFTLSKIQDPVWGGLVRQVHRIPSTTVFLYSNGMYGKGADGNPIGWSKDGGHNISKDVRIFETFYTTLSPLPSLKITGSYTINNLTHNQYNRRYDLYYGDGSSQLSNLGENWDNAERTNTWILRANYAKTFGQKHNVAAVAGYQYEYFNGRYTYFSRSGFPNNSVDELTGANASTSYTDGSSYEERTASYFSRLNYDYAGRYLVEVNMRADGSSKFAPANRWGYFPSVSAGWRLSEENFLKGVGWLSNLKLRGSWGSLGNNRAVDRYYYLQRIGLGVNYTFNNVLATGATQTAANNPDITWERTKEANVGLDIGFFNKLNVTLDVYNRRTTNILTTVPVTAAYGLNAPVVNKGELQNKGIELLIGWNEKQGAVQYSISANVSYNKNVVTRFETPSIGNRVYQEGHKWGEFYGWQWTGFFNTDDEANTSPHQVGAPVKAGDLKFKDQNGDGKIDGNDRVYLGGSDVPNWNFGLNGSAQFKGFDLTVFFQGAAGVKQLLEGDAFYVFENGGNLRTWQAENHWTPTNLNPLYPRLTVNQLHNKTVSSFSIRDRDYVRLKNLQIGYSLPSALLSKVKIQRLRVYVTASNVFTLQKNAFLQWDPETISTGNGLYGQDPHDIVPNTKVYAIGLNVTF